MYIKFPVQILKPKIRNQSTVPISWYLKNVNEIYSFQLSKPAIEQTISIKFLTESTFLFYFFYNSITGDLNL